MKGIPSPRRSRPRGPIFRSGPVDSSAIRRARARGRSAALIVAAPAARSATEERPAPVIVERSFVGPGLIGLIARGASDTIWRDCLIGSTEQAFSIERSGSDRGPARLTLRHTSLIAGDGPVFRVEENRAIVAGRRLRHRRGGGLGGHPRVDRRPVSTRLARPGESLRADRPVPGPRPGRRRRPGDPFLPELGRGRRGRPRGRFDGRRS